MHTIRHALEQARASRRVHVAMRATGQALFYSIIALLSDTWMLAIPLWLFWGTPDPARVLVLLATPGIVWFLVWNERRDDATAERGWARARGAAAC